MALLHTPLAAAFLAQGLGLHLSVRAQTTAAPVEAAASAASAPRADPGKRAPIILQAQSVRGRPDLETIAEGDAEFQRGPVVIKADQLSYEHGDDLARAKGGVRVSRDGNLYTGRELQLRVQEFEGYFLEPTYFFSRTGAGGSASRIDFLDPQRSRLTGATYSSCQPDGTGSPAWLLSTDSVSLDLETNEGRAEGAVLRFYGVPILAAPRFSFPLSDARKSGWLPPGLNLDSKSGLELRVPYYWNIAPQRDATFTPSIISRRGFGLDSEFRYLEPTYRGRLDLSLLPHDRIQGATRHAYEIEHTGEAAQGVDYAIGVLRVSDDNYWKDFPRAVSSLTPRLLATDVNASRRFGALDDAGLGFAVTTYARLQQWQVLQDTDPTALITSPYQRSPQVGARGTGRVMVPGLPVGIDVGLETEYNHFTLPDAERDPTRLTGSRVHALGYAALPYATPGWTLTPKVAFNAASYDTDQALADGSHSASRFIPTFSLDSAWTFERNTAWFGRDLRQTLEPRLLYVDTPFRNQDQLPNFDAAARDFNFESIYTDNAFSGVDRVSDAQQLTAGVTSRWLDPESGAEALRLGAVQRYLFSDQRITPEGVPFTQHVSDVLLLASTSLIPQWKLDGSVEYSPELKRTVRSILGASYSPGPFRTVSATYRLARGATEQIELGWQWPLFQQRAPNAQLAESVRRASPANGTRTLAGSSCSGTAYAVGRVNYSMRDARVNDAIVGVEYDAGCWIARVVAERLSTGRSEATTRLLMQLELVGLSRLGTNPLKVLKDNVPGYQLLRDDRDSPVFP